jgi:hypothetical protein
VILLISASSVARITSVSHQCPPFLTLQRGKFYFDSQFWRSGGSTVWVPTEAAHHKVTHITSQEGKRKRKGWGHSPLKGDLKTSQRSHLLKISPSPSSPNLGTKPLTQSLWGHSGAKP